MTAGCLESGLKLDLNKLMRQRFLQPGWRVGPYCLRWTNTYTGEEVATALITANMGRQQGWLRIKLGNQATRRLLHAFLLQKRLAPGGIRKIVHRR